MDRLSKDQRSRLMAKIGPRHTKPELLVRKAVHKLGYRFRLHRRDLPGTPDLVLPRFRLAIFVHGCFWHRHPGCRAATTPKSNKAFWAEKFERNQLRDKRNIKALRAMGWKVGLVWGCEAVDCTRLERCLSKLFKIHGYSGKL